jgi:hypothetical protein
MAKWSRAYLAELAMSNRLKRGMKERKGLPWPFRVRDDYIEWFNLHTQTWIIPRGSSDSLGYRMLTWKLPDGSRVWKRAHIVCWITHYGQVPNGLEIDHIDGDKANNSIHNLRVVTHAQNIQYAVDRLGHWGPRKLKPWQVDLVLAICPDYPWPYLRQLAQRWGVSKNMLGNKRAVAKRVGDPRYCAIL